MAQDEELFKTTRMALLRGAKPTYLPGQAVFLQREVKGFAKGTEGRIVTVQAIRPGEHRYQLLIGNEKLWAFEADVRPTPPGDSPLAVGAGGDLSITQRLQTMSLSQRMATLGVDETRRLNDLSATRRMHALSPQERLKEMLKTNRSQTLAADGDAAAQGRPAEAEDTGSAAGPGEPSDAKP